MKGSRLDWRLILERAAKIVESYDTGVTLRQLFYRLVSAQVLPNKQTAYKTLSERTAEARRQGEFPALIDRTRTIYRNVSFSGPADARRWLADIYRRDRTEGQETALYLGVEKHGIVNQLRAWFGHYGVRVISLGGYSSQTYVDDILQDAEEDGRPAVLIYAGDWDPSGEDIERDLAERCPVFDEIRRIALTEVQVRRYNLPENPGKRADPRAVSFEAKYGRLAQVEVDALPPETLRDLFAAAVEQFVDMSVFNRVRRKEEADRKKLRG
jgi:hypothetical protein